MGGLIDFFFGKPPPTNLKPQLDDLGIDANALGDAIGEVHGRFISKGKLIWLSGNKLTENVTVKKYGGGLFSGFKKKKARSYSYSATFAIVLGEAQPGARVARMWLENDLVINDAHEYSDFTGFPDYLIYNILQSRKNQSSDLKYRFYDGTQTTADEAMIADLGSDAPAYTGSMMIVFDNISVEDYGRGIPGVRVEAISSPAYNIDLIDSVTVTDPYGSGNFNAVPVTLSVSESTVLIPSWASSYPADPTYRTVKRYFDNVATVSGAVGFTPIDSAYTPPSGLNDTHTIYREQAEFDHTGVDSVRYTGGMYQVRNGVTIYAGSNSGAGEKRIYCRNGTTTTYMVGGAWAVCLSSDGNYIYRLTATKIEMYTQGFVLVADIEHNYTPASTESYGTNWLNHDGDRLYYSRGSNGQALRVFDEYLTENIYNGSLSAPSVSIGSVEVAVENGILIRAYESSAGTSITIDSYAVGRLTGTTYDLESKVEELASKVGLTLDASDLSGMTFRGFKTGSESARSYLEELQAAYLFDIIPDGYTLKAIRREGKTSGGVLAWDDLAATTRSKPVTRVASEWEEADRLPYRLELSYVDPEIEYDKNAQDAYYPTRSRHEEKVEVSLAMTPDEAAQLADKLIKLRHVERQLFEINLPQTYLGLKPSDVRTLETTAKNYVVRVNEVTETSSQILKCTVVLTDSTVYESTATGMSGNIPVEVIPTKLPAITHFIDAPMIYDDQDEPGYLVAMWGQGYWPGGELWRSSDGGTTYDSVQGFEEGVGIGYALGTLSSDEGYVVDRSSTLNIRVANGTFTTGNDLFADEGLCFYGSQGRWEIMQYTDAATESDSTVTLSGFIRGRKGTEWATGLHEIDDVIILLDVDYVNFIGDTLSSLNVEQLFLGVTSGLEDQLTDDDDIAFTYAGENLKPLSPVHGNSVYASSDSSMEISFTGRTRFNSEWWSTGVQPDNEPTVTYEIDVLDGPGGNVLRTLTGTPPIRYSGDDQTTDFGSPPSSVDVAVYQVGADICRGRGYEFNTEAIEWVPPTWLTTHDTGNMTYSADAMVATSKNSGTASCRTELGQSTNKFVWEVVVTNTTAGVFVGIWGETRKTNTTSTVGSLSHGWGFSPTAGFYNQGSFSSSGGITYSVGDVLTMMVDADANTITITRNNNEATVTKSIQSSSEPYYPTCTTTIGGGGVVFTLETNPSNMTWASTLHPGVKELGYYE